MTEYKVWAYARSAVPNLTALENQLEEVMREADKRGYILVNASMELKRGTELCARRCFLYLKLCGRAVSTLLWCRVLTG